MPIRVHTVNVSPSVGSSITPHDMTCIAVFARISKFHIFTAQDIRCGLIIARKRYRQKRE